MEKDVKYHELSYFPWVQLVESIYLDKEACIVRYEEHMQEVERHVPKDRLLEMFIAEGWEPLCKFLDVPIPKVPFPHANRKESFEVLQTVLVVVSLFYPFIFSFLGIFLFFAIWKLARGLIAVMGLSRKKAEKEKRA